MNDTLPTMATVRSKVAVLRDLRLAQFELGDLRKTNADLTKRLLKAEQRIVKLKAKLKKCKGQQ